MLSQRSFLRAPQRLSVQTRPSPIRSPFQRRFAHSDGPQLTGAADNAFNRERQAVKAHAAATSGKKVYFNTVHSCTDHDSDTWRKLSI